MYEAILQFVEGVILSPWETLGFATLLFHVERGYILSRYILFPRYRYCRLLRKNIKMITSDFIKVYTLYQEVEATKKDVASLTESILHLNINASLPLLIMRQITSTTNAHLFSKKLHLKVLEGLKKWDAQHEYILLHNKCPKVLLSPEELENMVKDLLDNIPHSFFSSLTSYFTFVNLNFKRPKSVKEDFVDALFALGQAKKIELFLHSKELGSLSADESVRYYVSEIKTAYVQKNESRCKDLFYIVENRAIAQEIKRKFYAG